MIGRSTPGFGAHEVVKDVESGAPVEEASMGKKHHKHHNRDATSGLEPTNPKPMKKKEYNAELKKLHVELVAMQEWVKSTGAKVCVVFEGRDTAGKGGVIKAITERVSPRVFRVVALPAPTDREKTQMYMQRYVEHLPSGGEVVIFDRSWYNRAGVEKVMGFCTPQQTQQFLEDVPAFERAVVASGVILLKYWLEVGEEQQTLRLQGRIDDPRKYWKLSPMDLKSYTPLGRLLAGARRHVPLLRHRLGTLVCGQHRRQEAGPPQRHQPPARPGALHPAAQTCDRTVEAQNRSLSQPRSRIAAHSHPVLSVAGNTSEP